MIESGDRKQNYTPDSTMTAMHFCIATATSDYCWYSLTGGAPVKQDETNRPAIVEMLEKRQFAELNGVTFYRRTGIDEALFGCHWASSPIDCSDYRGRLIRFFVVVEWNEARNAMEFAARLIQAGREQPQACAALGLRLVQVATGEENDSARIRQDIIDFVANLPLASAATAATLADGETNLIAADTPENRSILAKALHDQLPGMQRTTSPILVAVLENAGPKGLSEFAWRGLTTLASKEAGWINANPTPAPPNRPQPTSRGSNDAQKIVLTGVLLLGGVAFLLWLIVRRH